MRLVKEMDEIEILFEHMFIDLEDGGLGRELSIKKEVEEG